MLDMLINILHQFSTSWETKKLHMLDSFIARVLECKLGSIGELLEVFWTRFFMLHFWLSSDVVKLFRSSCSYMNQYCYTFHPRSDAHWNCACRYSGSSSSHWIIVVLHVLLISHSGNFHLTFTLPVFSTIF